jgi:hypothetical protein
MNKPEHNQDQAEAKKKRYLVIGVWVFSTIILLLWIISLRMSFRSNSFNVSSSETEAWQEDLDQSISYFQDNLSLLNESNQAIENRKVDVEGQVFLQDMKNNLTEKKMKTEIVNNEFQELELIKSESDKLLKNLENKINNNLSCPVFINCMPGPDRAGPCSVPPGCEDITQIAY